MAEKVVYCATGRRKTSIATVRMSNGSGAIKVNGLDVKDYFNRDALVMMLKQPLEITDTVGKFDIIAKVIGGGKAGQAGALRHSISRALLEYDVELRGALKKVGFLTRDARQKERKKYGLKSARRRFQFSKR